MRTFLIVIDSFGVGAMPDAYKYGDEGSNTFVNMYHKVKFDLPNLASLGLYNIDGVNLPYNGKIIGSYAKMHELAPAKDTVAGHYEISGIRVKHPNPVYPDGFPEDLVRKIEKAAGIKFIGNVNASGTVIINQLGDESIAKKCAILYTSADSVFQIACHESVLTIDELYRVCEIARKILKGKHNVSRVIARPFAGTSGNYYRTPLRKDFSLNPPKPSMLVYLNKKGYEVIGVGKIEDIFCSKGLTQSYHTHDNTEAIAKMAELVRTDFNGLVFANYNDTDMVYGHRNNVQGYADALVQIDNSIPDLIANLHDDDLLIVTADHGCDPTTESPNHSREYTPLLIYGKKITAGVNLGTLIGFDNIGRSIMDHYGVKKFNKSFLRVLSYDSKR